MWISLVLFCRYFLKGIMESNVSLNNIVGNICLVIYKTVLKGRSSSNWSRGSSHLPNIIVCWVQRLVLITFEESVLVVTKNVFIAHQCCVNMFLFSVLIFLHFSWFSSLLLILNVAGNEVGHSLGVRDFRSWSKSLNFLTNSNHIVGDLSNTGICILWRFCCMSHVIDWWSIDVNLRSFNQKKGKLFFSWLQFIKHIYQVLPLHEINE